VGLKDADFCAASLEVANIVVGQSAVEGVAFGQFAFDVLKLLAANAEGVEVAGDFIGRPHAFEDDATGLAGVARAALRDDCAGLCVSEPNEKEEKRECSKENTLQLRTSEGREFEHVNRCQSSRRDAECGRRRYGSAGRGGLRAVPEACQRRWACGSSRADAQAKSRGSQRTFLIISAREGRAG
jgi:hypothetical protein